MGQPVVRDDLRLEAIRAESHSKVLTEIAIELRIEREDLDPTRVRKAIAAACTLFSRVVDTVGKAAKLVQTFFLKDATTGQEAFGSLEMPAASS